PPSGSTASTPETAVRVEPDARRNRRHRRSDSSGAVAPRPVRRRSVEPMPAAGDRASRHGDQRLAWMDHPNYWGRPIPRANAMLADSVAVLVPGFGFLAMIWFDFDPTRIWGTGARSLGGSPRVVGWFAIILLFVVFPLAVTIISLTVRP